MRWIGKIYGEQRIIRRFAIFPIKANSEWRWLEFVKIRQTWYGGSWHNDWFEE